MMQIEELALKVADELNEMKHKGKSFAARDAVIDDYAIRFATRFLAAYAEQQEPVAWWDGDGGDEELAFSMTKGIDRCFPLYAAPPLPAIPERLCVVPREPTLEMVIAGENMIGRHAYAAMIAAGEVKP